MSIAKVDNLNFERTFLTDRGNDEINIEFDKNGIYIDYDLIKWADVLKAYQILFNKREFERGDV